MFFRRNRLLVVANPFPAAGGGGYRALLSIKEYEKRGIKPSIIFPWFVGKQRIDKEVTIDLRKHGIGLVGGLYLPRFFDMKFPLRRTLAKILAYSCPNLLKMSFNGKLLKNYDGIMSLHEVFDALTTTSVIGEKFSIRKGVLLQLPAYYKLKDRIENIKAAFIMWQKVLNVNPLLESASLIIYDNVVSQVMSKCIKNIIQNFDLVLAVSRAIPIEMDNELESKMIILDPGVGLSKEDLQLIEYYSRTTRKCNFIIFGGRPSPEKGLIEALIAWSKISKSTCPDFKLIITGNIPFEILNKLKKFAFKMNILNKVQFTGYISRKERLKLTAKAKMMIYPSHVDAFPYAVLEALYLNTPVVAYEIPALKTYYKNYEGVTLVRELDVDALVQKSIDIIQTKKFKIAEPRFTKTWDQIMDTETNLIKKYLLKI